MSTRNSSMIREGGDMSGGCTTALKLASLNANVASWSRSWWRRVAVGGAMNPRGLG